MKSKRDATGRFGRTERAERDLVKVYTREQFVAKLRRFADALEEGKRFRIQIAGERVSVPPDAVFDIEHEREEGTEEIEFQITWRSD